MGKKNIKQSQIKDDNDNYSKKEKEKIKENQVETPFITFAELVSREPEPLDFIIDGFVNHTVGLLTGASGIGKSFFALQLCFALADSTKRINFLDLCNEKRGKVVYISAQDDEDILRYRIKAVGQDIIQKNPNNFKILNAIDENLEIISVVGKMPLIYSENRYDESTEDRINECRNLLLQISEGKRLIIIDSLRQFHHGEENNIHYMYNVIDVFLKIAIENNCAVLLVDNRGDYGIIKYHINIAKINKEYAKKHKINEQERNNYLEVSFPKANYVPPMGERWLKRLGNGVLKDFNGNKVQNASWIKRDED